MHTGITASDATHVRTRARALTHGRTQAWVRCTKPRTDRHGITLSPAQIRTRTFTVDPRQHAPTHSHGRFQLAPNRERQSEEIGASPERISGPAQGAHSAHRCGAGQVCVLQTDQTLPRTRRRPPPRRHRRWRHATPSRFRVIVRYRDSEACVHLCTSPKGLRVCVSACRQVCLRVLHSF